MAYFSPSRTDHHRPLARVALGLLTLSLSLVALSNDTPWWLWPMLFAIHWWGGVASLGYVGHMQAHKRLLRSRMANRVLEGVLALLTGMTVDSWRITHVLGHHRSHWEQLQRSTKHAYLGLQEHHPALQRYGLARGVCFAGRTLWAQWWGYLAYTGRQAANRSFRAPLYQRGLQQAAAYAMVMLLLTVWQPLWTLLFLWLPHAMSHFFSRYVDYLFHAGARPQSHYLFCFTCLNPSYNQDAFNTGYHVAHHYWPRASWQELPALYQSLKQDHPELALGERQTSFAGGNWRQHHALESGREHWLDPVHCAT